MLEKISTIIVRHLSLTELVLVESKNICNASRRGKIDQVMLLSENRERLINIVGALQNQIERHLSTLDSSNVSKSDLEIFQCWLADYENIKSGVDQIDNEITNHLELEKEETTKQIATLFKKQGQIKGYNLRNTRK